MLWRSAILLFKNHDFLVILTISLVIRRESLTFIIDLMPPYVLLAAATPWDISNFTFHMYISSVILLHWVTGLPSAVQMWLELPASCKIIFISYKKKRPLELHCKVTPFEEFIAIASCRKNLTLCHPRSLSDPNQRKQRWLSLSLLPRTGHSNVKFALL